MTANSSGTRASVSPATWRYGSPAANTITPTIASRVNAVPKSGSSTIRPQTTPVTRTTGASARAARSIESMRRSRVAATNRMTATFANSEGWMPTPATENHRRVPLIAGPKKTTMRATTVIARAP